MPHPRAVSIVLCSCGWRAGNLQRAAACEEMEAVEYVLIEREVPRMIRHFELRHTLKLGENAPRSFLGVIAEAARRVKEAREGRADEEPIEVERRGLLGPTED
ncbi:MAG TPA: hypothetical protein VHG72_13890 [Polyangia bacterium]|nr:hypothetical protein [Polyangia bacterium]